MASLLYFSFGKALTMPGPEDATALRLDHHLSLKNTPLSLPRSNPLTLSRSNVLRINLDVRGFYG